MGWRADLQGTNGSRGSTFSFPPFVFSSGNFHSPHTCLYTNMFLIPPFLPWGLRVTCLALLLHFVQAQGLPKNIMANWGGQSWDLLDLALIPSLLQVRSPPHSSRSMFPHLGISVWEEAFWKGILNRAKGYSSPLGCPFPHPNTLYGGK